MSEIDLHQFSKEQAINILKKEIPKHPPGTKISFITGWGRHSPNNKPVLKPAFRRFCKRHKIHIIEYTGSFDLYTPPYWKLRS